MRPLCFLALASEQAVEGRSASRRVAVPLLLLPGQVLRERTSTNANMMGAQQREVRAKTHTHTHAHTHMLAHVPTHTSAVINREPVRSNSA